MQCKAMLKRGAIFIGERERKETPAYAMINSSGRVTRFGAVSAHGRAKDVPKFGHISKDAQRVCSKEPEGRRASARKTRVYCSGSYPRRVSKPTLCYPSAKVREDSKEASLSHKGTSLAA